MVKMQFLSPRTLSFCFVLLLQAAASSLCAQSMRNLFIDMPESVEPLLSRNNRLDLVDFADSHMKAEVDNALDGKSRLISLTPTHCVLQSSPAVRKEFLLLPYRGTDIVLGVFTYASPAPESEVHFFATDWQPLSEAPVVEWPLTADFWVASDTCDSAALARARRLLDVAYVSASILPDSLVLECSLSLDNLAPEDRAAVAPYVVKKVFLKWTGDAFRRIRND